MRRLIRTLVFAACACLVMAPAARADVQVSIRNGRVTIVAKDATLRQILTEWARVGKTKIVNAERVPGSPLTLELRDVPEAEALDVLLRNLSGYIAAPRTTAAAADASVYDSIVVMPTIAPAVARTAGPVNTLPPFAAPTFTPQEEQENNQPQPQPVAQPARPPIFSTFPTPQGGPTSARPMLPTVRPGLVPQPQLPSTGEAPAQQQFPVAGPAVPAPATAPGQLSTPVGSSAPGMMPPATAQPGQVVQPQRPPGE